MKCITDRYINASLNCWAIVAKKSEYPIEYNYDWWIWSDVLEKCLELNILNGLIPE